MARPGRAAIARGYNSRFGFRVDGLQCSEPGFDDSTVCYGSTSAIA